MRHLLGMVWIVALSGSASAQSIDMQGATQLSQSLARYLSQPVFDKGIVSITPDGDAYKIAVDMNALAALAPVENPVKFDVSPSSFRLKPATDGTWRVDGNLFPNGWIEVSAGKVQERTDWTVTGGTMTGVFDPELGAFSSASGSYGGIRMTSKGVSGESETTYGPGTVTMTGTKSANGGVDFSSTQTMTDLAQTTNVVIPDNDARITIAMKAASMSADARGQGFKTKSFFDLLAFGVGNPDAEKVKANQAELKSLVLAALPGWEHIDGAYALTGFEVTSPVGILRAASIGASFSNDGIRQNGSVNYGIQASKMELASLFLPRWAPALIPTELDLNLSGTNLNLDAPARKLIDALDLSRDPPIPANVTEGILAEFSANPPKIVFAKSMIGNADTRIVAEGEMTFVGGKPNVDVTFDATGYDKVVAALQAAAPSDPTAAEILPVARFVQEHANTMPGGHLQWRVQVEPNGAVTLNDVLVKPADPVPLPAPL